MAQYFFVGGNPKSGTTWMQLMLDAHPEVTCSGEGHFIDKLLDPLVKMKEDYNRQQALDAERVYEGKPFYKAMENAQVIEAARVLMTSMITQRATKKSRVIGDKTPLNNRNFSDFAVIFPQAKFINIVRNPYDVTVSRLHHALRAGITAALDSTTEQHATLVTNSALAWKMGQERVEQFIVQRPGKIRQVRYEDMLERPAEGATELFTFLGVSAAPPLIERIVNDTSFKALSGRDRGDENRQSFFRKGVAGDWEGVLDRQALDLVNAQCGDLMIKAGYEIA